MKKAILVVAFLMLTTLGAYAIEKEFTSDTGNTGGHTSKNVNQPAQTNFERLGSSGNQTVGNSGYLALMAVDDNGRNYPYYLWVDGSKGNLCISSYPTISTFSSFPGGDWRSTTGMTCTKVGSQ